MLLNTLCRFLIYLILQTCFIIRSSTEFEDYLGSLDWYNDKTSENMYYDSYGDDNYYEENIPKLSENEYTGTKRNLDGYYSSEYYESKEYSNPEGNFNNILDFT